MLKTTVQEHMDINGQGQIQRPMCEPLSYVPPCSELISGLLKNAWQKTPLGWRRIKKKNLIVALVDFCAVNMPTVVDLKIPTDCGQWQRC